MQIIVENVADCQREYRSNFLERNFSFPISILATRCRKLRKVNSLIIDLLAAT